MGKDTIAFVNHSKNAENPKEALDLLNESVAKAPPKNLRVAIEELIKVKQKNQEAAAKKNGRILTKKYSLNRVVEELVLPSSSITDMLNRKTKPDRNRLIQITYFLGASKEQMNEVLQLAGLSPLYERNKDELLISWGLENKRSYDEMTEILEEQNSNIKF